MHSAQNEGRECALDDGTICKQFGISKSTLLRWRNKHGFPKPDFFVGPRPFTWESRPRQWAARQPANSPIATRRLRIPGNLAADSGLT